MALSERTRLYEVLIRVREDGSVAAHQQSINEVLRDGAVISAIILDPVPLGGDELSAAEALVAGIGA